MQVKNKNRTHNGEMCLCLNRCCKSQLAESSDWSWVWGLPRWVHPVCHLERHVHPGRTWSGLSLNTVICLWIDCVISVTAHPAERVSKEGRGQVFISSVLLRPQEQVSIKDKGRMGASCSARDKEFPPYFMLSCFISPQKKMENYSETESLRHLSSQPCPSPHCLHHTLRKQHRKVLCKQYGSL